VLGLQASALLQFVVQHTLFAPPLSLSTQYPLLHWSPAPQLLPGGSVGWHWAGVAVVLQKLPCAQFVSFVQVVLHVLPALPQASPPEQLLAQQTGFPALLLSTQ
jgi:hypothetical protein